MPQKKKLYGEKRSRLTFGTSNAIYNLWSPAMERAVTCGARGPGFDPSYISSYISNIR